MEADSADMEMDDMADLLDVAMAGMGDEMEMENEADDVDEADMRVRETMTTTVTLTLIGYGGARGDPCRDEATDQGSEGQDLKPLPSS